MINKRQLYKGVIKGAAESNKTNQNKPTKEGDKNPNHTRSNEQA